jgi:hypothetical protein
MIEFDVRNVFERCFKIVNMDVTFDNICLFTENAYISSIIFIIEA